MRYRPFLNVSGSWSSDPPSGSALTTLNQDRGMGRNYPSGDHPRSPTLAPGVITPPGSGMRGMTKTAAAQAFGVSRYAIHLYWGQACVVALLSLIHISETTRP